MGLLESKIAIITGGGRGIGKATAQLFINEGATVVIAEFDEVSGQSTANELGAHFIKTDISNEESVNALFNFVSSEFGQLDILVNNAGAAWGAAFEEYPDEGYDKVMNINVRAIFMLTRDLMPLLTKNATSENPSRVINIGSIDGLRVSTTDNFAYGASKAAVHFLTKNLSVRLASKGLTVNAIAPGPFESQMMDYMLTNYRGQIEARNPMGRIGCPEDMAGLAIYLASEAAKYVTGQIIALDGGSNLGSHQERFAG